MTTREEAARAALHAELQELARRPGRGGTFEVRVFVEANKDGHRVESSTETGRHVRKRGSGG